MGNTWGYYTNPDENPFDKTPCEFDTLKGFPEGARKKKIQRVSAAEIESMQIPEEFLDFCLHKNLEYKSCQADNWPFVSRCAHYIHHYHSCMYEETIDRMRDYEREKRLMKRRNKKRLEEEKKRQVATLAN